MGHLQKLFIFISGFSWPCVGFSLVLVSGVYSGYGVWASRYSSSSHCRAWALGMPALVVGAHGLSCSKARGIFLDQGSSHCLQHWKEDSSPLDRQGSLMWTSFKVFHFHFIEFTTILLLFYASGFFGHKACGSLAPWTRDRTRSPFLGRWILSHWTTSEVPVTVTVSLTVFWLSCCLSFQLPCSEAPSSASSYSISAPRQMLAWPAAPCRPHVAHRLLLSVKFYGKYSLTQWLLHGQWPF